MNSTKILVWNLQLIYTKLTKNMSEQLKQNKVLQQNPAPPPPPAPNCNQPFTPCWCASRPNHPKCKDVETVPIHDYYFDITIFGLIIIFTLRKLIFKK